MRSVHGDGLVRIPPRQQPRIIERPTATPAGGEGAEGAGGVDKKKDAKGGPDMSQVKPLQAALVGFGETSDATADINPETSPNKKLDRGDEMGRELSGISAADMKNAMLPSEQGANDVDKLQELDPFQAQDDAFDAAGGDMERGLEAQRAIGKQREVEYVEDPSDVGPAGDSPQSDPSDPANPDRFAAQGGLDPELLGLGVSGASASATTGDPLQQDFDQQLDETRMRGLPARNNKLDA
jgi:hypothetical protein